MGGDIISPPRQQMFKKIAIFFGVTLVTVLIALLAIPVIFQKQIDKRIKEEINNRVSATVNYTGFNISVFWSFPNLSVSLNNLTVIGQNEFNGDTLADIDRLSFAISLWGIIKGQGYHVISLSVKQPVLKLKVNNSGLANWNVIKQLQAFSKDTIPVTANTDTGLSFQISNWKVEHAVVEYRNDTAHVFFSANDLDAEWQQKDGKYIDVNTAVKELSYRAGDIAYLRHLKGSAKIRLSEISSGKYQIGENSIALNELHLKLQGSVENNFRSQNIDVTLQSVDRAFKSLLSAMPGVYDSSYAGLKTGGSFLLTGRVKGVNDETQSPAVSFKLNISGGMLQKNGFPHPVKNIYVNADMVKPQGPWDSTVFKISRLHLEEGNDSLNGKLSVTTPATNAFVSAEMKGSFDISGISQFYKIDDVEQLTGNAKVDLQIQFHQQDVANKNYNAIKSFGQMEVTDACFKKREWKDSLTISEAFLDMVPAFVSISLREARIGKNRFKSLGDIRQLIPYLAGQAPLKINLGLSADSIDILALTGRNKQALPSKNINGAKGSSATGNETKTVSSKPIELEIHVIARKASYDKILLKNVAGELDIAGNRFEIKNIAADIFGGRTFISALCNDYHAQTPEVRFNSNTTGMDITQLYRAFDNADKTAPALKYVTGNFSGQISGTGKLKPDYSLNFNALNANGNTRFADLKIDEMPVLMQIGRLAKAKSLDHLEAKNVLSAFRYNNGTTTIDSTDIKFTSGYRINFRGTNYANQTVDADINLSVPVKEFGSVASLAQNLLSSFMSVPDNVKFDFKVTGKNTEPLVKLLNVGTSGN